MQSIADYLDQRGYRRGLRAGMKAGLERGREKARAEGREEGRLVVLREAVNRVLLTRFKKVPRTIQKRLASADAATLERWHLKALTCRTATAVLADD